MRLSKLFEECLREGYTHVENGGDFRLFRREGELYIFFAHSDGVLDWKNNLDFPAKASVREEAPHLFVHRGFLRVWMGVEKHVAPAIQDTRTKSITVVGYSHGAALAVLCYDYALRARPALQDKITGYGFGCPRVLWGIKTAAVRERFKRFTVIRNIDDIVTHVPPAALGYYHVGKMLEMGKKGKYSPVDAHRAENMLAELKSLEASI
ncbi:MAG: lipase family protein [Ruminococcaceae bacterium]|nr:lipase family protein [Oscillospiraceae bacterium]